MTLKLGAREARNQFSNLLGRVGYGGEVVVLERSGKPIAVMVPVEMYEKFLAEREQQFAVVDRIRQNSPEISEDEISNDINEAMIDFRSSHAASGS
jgi:prevent-host-death family protein